MNCPSCDRPLQNSLNVLRCNTVRCELRNAHFDTALLNKTLSLKAQLKYALALLPNSERHDNLRDVIGQALHTAIAEFDLADGIDVNYLLESDFIDSVADSVIEQFGK